MAGTDRISPRTSFAIPMDTAQLIGHISNDTKPAYSCLPADYGRRFQELA